MFDPFDPDLDAACASCAKGLHGACLGWWHWCPCACGLDPNDPRTNLNGKQGEP